MCEQPQKALWATIGQHWATRSRVLMSIQKRQRATGKTVYRVMWRDHEGAQRSQSFKTLGDAKRFDAQLELGHVPEARSADAKMTVAGWIQEWFDTYSSEWRTTTHLTRANICDKWILPMIGTQPLAAVTSRSCRAFRQQMLDNGATKSRANTVMTVFSAAMTAAADSGVIDQNPVYGIRRLGVQKASINAPAPLAVEEWRHWMPTDRDRLIVSLIAYAGIRPGELCGLQWKHVHPNHLLIVQSGQYGEIEPTKTGKFRSIELCEALREELAAYRPANADPDAFVIAGVKGGMLSWRNWYRRVWGDARKHVSADNRAYDLRHTFASLQIHSGRNVMQVAAELGHAKPTMTLDTYAHVFTESQMQSRMGVDEAILLARKEIAERSTVIQQAALDASE